MRLLVSFGFVPRPSFILNPITSFLPYFFSTPVRPRHTSSKHQCLPLLCVSTKRDSAHASNLDSKCREKPTSKVFRSQSRLHRRIAPVLCTLLLLLNPSLCTLSTSHVLKFSPVYTHAHARNLPESNGAKGNAIGRVEALVPIVKMQQIISQVDDIINRTHEENTSTGDHGDGPTMDWSPLVHQCSRLLNNLERDLPRNEKELKRIFDEYSEPVSYKQRFLDQNAFLVYYTKGFDGPQRPNIENDNEKSLKQKAQYQARNQVWLAIDQVRAELEYLEKLDPTKRKDGAELNILRKEIVKAKNAMHSYLSLAPAEQLQEAQLILNTCTKR